MVYYIGPWQAWIEVMYISKSLFSERNGSPYGIPARPVRQGTRRKVTINWSWRRDQWKRKVSVTHGSAILLKRGVKQLTKGSKVSSGSDPFIKLGPVQLSQRAVISQRLHSLHYW